MIYSISDRLTNRLMKHVHYDYINKQVLFYGTSTIVYTLFSTIGLVIVGWLFHSPINAVILISIFYTNQTIGGGYHANTHLSCFLTMSIALSISLLFLKLHFSAGILVIINSLSFFILFRYPIVLHPKRFFLKESFPLFARRSRVISTVEVAIQFLLLLSSTPLASTTSLGLLLSAISRCVAKKAYPIEME